MAAYGNTGDPLRPDNPTRHPTLGYHKIRGLGAPLRMMLYAKKQNFRHVAYGTDCNQKWFKEDKELLKKKNSCANLPYIVDGGLVVSQSNTCALYLGRRLGIDDGMSGTYQTYNHTVLDQTYDLRNDLMKVVYPFGTTKTRQDFEAAAKKHFERNVRTHFTKLEGFCIGPFMTGVKPRSGDFVLWEMLDQHIILARALDLDDWLGECPKLATLHSSMRALPELADYFAAPCYAEWSHNSPAYTHFTGHGDMDQGGTVEEDLVFPRE